MRCRSIALVSNEVDALRAVEGWPAEHVAVGLVSASEVDCSPRRRDARVPLGVGDEAGDGARLPGRGRGGRDRPRRAGRPAGLDLPASARPRLGLAARRAAARSRSPGERRIYSDHGFDVLGAGARRPRRDAVRRVSARGGAGAARPRRPLRGPPGLRRVRLARRPARARARAARADAGRAGDARRGDVRAVPGPGRRAARASAARSRTTGASGFELRDSKSPHWTGARNSPRTFGHFGRSGTFLWVDPDAGVALACLTDRDFGDWAVEAWPALSDAVLAEL